MEVEARYEGFSIFYEVILFLPLKQVTSCRIAFLAYFPAEIRIRINGLPVLYGLAIPLGWISTVSIGSLMVFCALFCSLLFLLCWCHPHIGDCAQPCLTSSSGPLVWKFTVNYFVLQRRGECIEIWVRFSAATKYLRKTKCCVC